MIRGAWRVVAGLLCFWLMVLIYTSLTLYQSGDVSERTERQLAKALQELDTLKRQNIQLQQLASELKDVRLLASRSGGGGCESVEKRLSDANKRLQAVLEDTQRRRDQHHVGPGDGGGGGIKHVLSDPGQLGVIDSEHEYLRRKITDGVKELWFFVRSQFNLLATTSPQHVSLTDMAERAIDNAEEHYRIIMTDIYNLSISGGAGDWRRREIQELSATIQNRFHHLQNPEDCSKAKKLVCSLNKGCGYGCQIHHLVYCMVVAYGTRRTLILESRGWRYAQDGWETVFLPFSETCTNRDGYPSKSWGPTSLSEDAQVIELPIVDSMHPRPDFMPLAIPEDIADRLIKLHGAPAVWWIGQLLKYILRPQPFLADDMEKAKVSLGFTSPVVGVHVRRTDKIGTEASYHSIEEYMVHVAEYYRLLAERQTVDVKRVYLATDDPALLEEAKEKYPEYKWISDNSFSQSAGLGTRYTDFSLKGIIMDIHFLSMSDYLVCTFSSQVCRLAYEIMQVYNVDASTWFYSLDDIFYFGGQNAHNQQALYKHVAQNIDEIDLHPGDLVGVAGNHWDGYSKGTSLTSGKMGLYPSFKVEDKVEIAKFPSYKDIDSKR